jgi:cell wall-associated NlpC family hydrolase
MTVHSTCFPMILKLLKVSLLFFSSFNSLAQPDLSFEQKMALPLGSTKAQTAQTMALTFVGQPYVPHTLEVTPEALVCNLTQFDCYTFVETVVALTWARHGNGQLADFQNHLQQNRYRNGQLNGYGSRIHYFLEWMQQAARNGVVKDITATLGGQQRTKTIDFMTKHRPLYAGLSDAAAVRQVAQAEAQLSKHTWYVIPKNQVARVESQLQDGDIVAMVSAVPGLDINHEGFVVKKGDRAYLLHASTEAKRVVVSSEPLADYLQRIKKHEGIVVLRM